MFSGELYAHFNCAAWSDGVTKTFEKLLSNVDKAVVAAAFQVLSSPLVCFIKLTALSIYRTIILQTLGKLFKLINQKTQLGATFCNMLFSSFRNAANVTGTVLLCGVVSPSAPRFTIIPAPSFQGRYR